MAVVCALAAGWFFHVRHEEAQRELARETASLRARIEQAEGSRDRELPRAVAEGLRRSLAAPVSTSSVLPSAAQDAGAAPVSAAARSEAMAQRLDALVAKEPAEPRWSRETADAAVAVFASVTGSRLVSADCRTNLCRFEVTSDSVDAQRELADQLVGQGPFAEDVWYYYDHEAQPPKATLFSARKGVPLGALLGGAPSRP